MVAGRKITVEFLGDSKDLQNAIGQVDGKSSKLGATLKKVGKAAALGLGLGVLAGGAALVKMTQGAAEDEAAQAKLAKTLKNTADATKGQVAAVEDWISAQGVALGVTDDELRPALSKLVTATHDVGKAQKLAALAMDVSAGSGKSLDSVATALMKAQNGQVAGLSKLGIQTKNAAGETMTFEQVTKSMAATFKGQAAAQADTLQGKMAKLKVILSEAGEEIGGKLIPIVTQLADWFMAKGLPAIQSFGDYISVNLVPTLTSIGAKLLSVAGFLNEHRTAILATAAAIGALVVVTQIHATVMAVQAAGGLAAMIKGLPIVTTLTKAWAAVQWILNAALTANPIGLVIAALVALGVGLVIAWKKSETFRSIVLGSWEAIKSATVTAFEKVKDVISSAFDFVKKIFLNFTGPGLIINHWETIKSATTNAWNAIKAAVSTAIGGVKDAINGLASIPGKVADFFDQARESAINKLQTLLSWIAGFPGRILTNLGNMGTLLYNAGSQIIQGLIDGITAKAAALKDKLTSITKMIPNWKGPLDKDKILLEPAGRALIDGLISGIESKKSKLETVLTKITDHIKKKQDALATLLDNRQSVVDSFKGFASSVFGADTGTEETPASAQSLVDFSANQKGKAETLNADVQALITKGLSKEMINELIASGQAGMDQIHLLASATDEQIAALNANQAATQAALAAAGLAAADAVMGGEIAKAAADVALADGIRDKLKELLEQQDKNTIVQLVLDGKVLHASLLKLKKAKNAKLELD